ncbi:MAG: TIGR02186 family protein [Pseudomonadota bacterium]
MIRALCLLLLWAGPVLAQEDIVADLSQKQVAITTTFTGSEILIFGAVRRGGLVDVTFPLEAVVTVSGPSEPVTVRRKDRVAGIWVNMAEVEVDAAPSFYAIASSAPLFDVLSHTEDLRHGISKARAIRLVGAAGQVDNPTDFREALIRIRQSEGTYNRDESGVTVLEETLLRASVGLPANLVEGDYAVRIFLTRNREVVSTFETTIAVEKVGLERFLYNLAHDRPLVYGIMSLVIAIAAGWLASAAFRLVRS